MSTVVAGGWELIWANENSRCGEFFPPAVGSMKEPWSKGTASSGKRTHMRLFRWLAMINGPVRLLFHWAKAWSRSKL
jgi:hypothetical protein